jgi:FMN phosphatase YigB (HAD superfamily)
VTPAPLVFLVDVDNTLVQNDAVKDALDAAIRRAIGPRQTELFWDIYEAVRQETEYVDYPLTLSRFRAQAPDERGFCHVADRVLGWPYQQWLYPGALDVLRHLNRLGRVAILSDGDPVYQPAKIARAGIADAVDDVVLVYAHKEAHLDELRRRLPAGRYVIVDDKPDILGRIKQRWRELACTVHVLQGKYASAAAPDDLPTPDLTIDGIAELLRFEAGSFGQG